MAVNLLEIKRIFGAGIGLCVFYVRHLGFVFLGGNRALLFLRGNWDFRASPQAETGPAHASTMLIIFKFAKSSDRLLRPM